MARYDDDDGQRRASHKSATKHSDPHPKDPQCMKQQGMLRCTLPVTWYPNNGTRGYCWIHDDDSRHLTGPELHDQLQDIRDHRQRYIIEHEAVAWREQMIDDCIEAHPDWIRGEDEGKREYALRMLSLTKPLGAEVRRRQHGLAR